MKKRISVVIVTFNSEKYIDNCLKSLFSSKYQVNEIIIVDNNSVDRTVKRVKKYKVKLIVNNTNLGFANAVNSGIRKAYYDSDILLLNPDTTLQRSAIDELVKCKESLKAGIAGGKCYRKDKSIHGTYVRKPTIFTILFVYTNLRKFVPFDYFHKRHYFEDDKLSMYSKEVDAVSGSFLLIDRKVLRTIGLLDQNFFMYLEDIDLCNRAKEIGTKIIYCPAAVTYHEGGASSANKDRINHEAWYRARKYYVSKYFPSPVSMILNAILDVDTLMTKVWQTLR